jgi:hypothetical protein
VGFPDYFFVRPFFPLPTQKKERKNKQINMCFSVKKILALRSENFALSQPNYLSPFG